MLGLESCFRPQNDRYVVLKLSSSSRFVSVGLSLRSLIGIGLEHVWLQVHQEIAQRLCDMRSSEMLLLALKTRYKSTAMPPPFLIILFGKHFCDLDLEPMTLKA